MLPTQSDKEPNISIAFVYSMVGFINNYKHLPVLILLQPIIKQTS